MREHLSCGYRIVYDRKIGPKEFLQNVMARMKRKRCTREKKPRTLLKGLDAWNLIRFNRGSGERLLRYSFQFSLNFFLSHWKIFFSSEETEIFETCLSSINGADCFILVNKRHMKWLIRRISCLNYAINVVFKPKKLLLVMIFVWNYIWLAVEGK